MKVPNWMRLSVKQSQTAKVMLQALRMPGPIPHIKYGSLSKESYERNVTVFLCVNLIATNGCGVPWTLMKRGAGGKKSRVMSKSTAYRAEMFRGMREGAVRKALRMTEIENHPALTLVERPNPGQSQAEYLNDLISYFLLSGNSYEEFVAPNRKNAPPQEMYTLRPDRVEVLPNTDENRRLNPDLAGIVDANEFVLGYGYCANDSGVTFAPASILHRKFFHPTNDYYGLSPLQVAARYYRTDNLSADWNYALLQNQARPSGALIAPTTIDDASYERLKQELADNYGGENSGVPMILEGGFDWKALGLTPLEMDWLSGTRDARGQICSVYHVPPEMTGNPEHRTYNSMPEARRALWMEAIMPVLDSIRDSYNRALIPLFGDGLYLDYDRDQIDALAEDQEKVWTRVHAASSLTVNEQREAIGYDVWEGDPENDPEADVPRSLIPRLSTQMPFGGEPAPAPVKTIVRDPETKLITGIVEQPAAQPAHVRAQALTTAQKSARAKLRRALKDHFSEQGSALARVLKNEIGKL
jgi:HK97 family phage portal protein